ncbi:putative Zn-finger protein [Sinorhizobium fredii]
MTAGTGSSRSASRNSCAPAASVPFDHPHIFIDMGDDNEKVCSYCSTLYRYNANLKATETVPPGCLFETKAA